MVCFQQLPKIKTVSKNEESEEEVEEEENVDEVVEYKDIIQDEQKAETGSLILKSEVGQKEEEKQESNKDNKTFRILEPEEEGIRGSALSYKSSLSKIQ